MPDPADRKHDQDIEILAHSALTVAPERNINIVAQPGCQRNMPAPPKIRDAHREIRPTEVFGQFKAHQLSDAKRHQRAAGKIEINLQRVSDRRDHNRQAGRLLKRTIDRINIDPEPIRDDHFKEAACQKKQRRSLHGFGGKTRPLLIKLNEQVLRAVDRAGEDLRKERHKGERLYRIALGAALAPRYIGQIADGFKRKIGDAKRQNDRLCHLPPGK